MARNLNPQNQPQRAHLMTKHLAPANTEDDALASTSPMVPSGHAVSSLFNPQSRAEAIQMCDGLAKSRLVPKQFQGDPWGIACAIEMGQRLGYSVMQSLQNIAVINGKPSIYGDELLARCKRSAVYEYVHEEFTGSFKDGTAVATCRAKRKGEDEVVHSFDMERANRAKLLGKAGPWQEYPERMLQMRARGFALRDAFPDVLAGIITREEAEDVPVRSATHGGPAEKPTGPIVDAQQPREARPKPPTEDTLSAEEREQLTVVRSAFSCVETREQLNHAVKLAERLPKHVAVFAKDDYRTAREVVKDTERRSAEDEQAQVSRSRRYMDAKKGHQSDEEQWSSWEGEAAGENSTEDAPL